MSKKILVVDDDESLRGILIKILDSCGFKTTGAADGQAGLSRFMAEDFDLVISDIRMPKLNGVELLQAIKSTKPVPVILITGFSELLETKEAFQLGANGFLAKPFKKDDLLEQVQQCLGVQISEEKKSQADDFCKLNLDDFVSGKQLQFDIFIRLSDDKFIKIAYGGDDLPPERISSYKNKGLRFLYMRKGDFAKYVGMNLMLMDAVQNRSDVVIEKKMHLMKHTGEMILQKVRISGLDEENYEYAKTFIDGVIGIMSENQDSMDLLVLLSNHTDFVYAHSVGVSMVSVLIAKQMGWVSIPNLFKIGMAGLLHDVGEKEISPEVLGKLRKDLSAEEIKLKKSHTSRGTDILSQLKGMPSDVIQVAAQHHEDCIGQGYPRGIRKSQIHPMARLVAVASEFCSLVLHSPNSPQMEGREAVKRLFTLSAQRLDGDFLHALAKLFKLNVPHGSAAKFGSNSELEWTT